MNYSLCGRQTGNFKPLLSFTSSITSRPLFELARLNQVTPGRRWQSTATAIRTTSDNRINGPTSTLPAPLDLPESTTGQNILVKLFNTGRAYVAFYKTGLRNVYYSYKAARHLQRTYQKQFPDTPLHALPSYVLSRSDFLLLYRSRNDVKRIPIFALVLIVCGEFTPLIIPFISGIVPLTCRIPRQLESDRRKLEERRSRSFRDLVTSPPPPPPPTSTPSVLGSKETTNAVVDQDDNSNAINISNDGVEILPYLDRQQLLHISRSLGLHSTYWADRFFPSLLPPAVLLRSRIHRRQVYLETDDRLIVRDGGVDRMDLEEVKMALVDRGVDVLHRSDDQLRLILRNWLWLTTTKRWGLYTLFLTRPSTWPSSFTS